MTNVRQRRQLNVNGHEHYVNAVLAVLQSTDSISFLEDTSDFFTAVLIRVSPVSYGQELITQYSTYYYFAPHSS